MGHSVREPLSGEGDDFGRWLIIGGAGYIGSHIAHELASENRSATILDNLVTGNKAALPETMTLVEGDASDAELVREVIEKYQIDGIVFLAARKQARESVVDPLGYWRDNLLPMLGTLTAASDSRVKNFILSSSCSVYGNYEYVTETSPLTPVSPYGRTKVASEWLLADFASIQGIQWVAMRYFNVIGNASFPFAPDRSTECIVPRTVQRISAGIRPTIYGSTFDTPDGTALRDYLDVRDLASAHVAMMFYMGRQVGRLDCAINVGTGRPVSVLNIVECISRELDWQGGLEFIQPLPGDPALVWSEPSSLLVEVGWKASRSLEESISSHCRHPESLVQHLQLNVGDSEDQSVKSL